MDMQEKTRIEIFRFNGAEGGVAELHAMIGVTDPTMTYQEQVGALMGAYDSLIQREAEGTVAVFNRFILSDAANQAD